ncbi:MAG: hypothetical protein LPK19_11080 [Hymenobacteraceae bacterium]|nr:hypothetical protein [Hymenobacteraceae bacterium]MDX5396776.1 hypothetical protein [Hymenobacteraceae bacterium]MDX5512839.1 hypothetical protein [Hymenobacteraceae bacterium]
MQENSNLPEMVAAFYNKLSGGSAEVTLNFDNLEVEVPNTASADQKPTRWRVNGSLCVRTGSVKDNQQS